MTGRLAILIARTARRLAFLDTTGRYTRRAVLAFMAANTLAAADTDPVARALAREWLPTEVTL